MKAILLDRYSFWVVLTSTGRKTWQAGTMIKHKGESEDRAMPRALKLIEEVEKDGQQIQLSL